MTQIVELPGLAVWASAFDNVLIDQDLDGPEVPSEVAGVLV